MEIRDCVRTGLYEKPLYQEEVKIIEKRYNLNAKLDPALYAQFKSACALQNITISDLISAFIVDFSRGNIQFTTDGNWTINSDPEE